MSKHAAAPKAGKTARRTSATRGHVLSSTGEFAIPGRGATIKVKTQSGAIQEAVAKTTKSAKAAAAAAVALEKKLARRVSDEPSEPFAKSSSAYGVWDTLLTHLSVDQPVSITPVLARNLLDIGLPARLVTGLTEMLGVSSTDLSYLMDIDRSTVTRLKQGDRVVPMHSAESILRLLEIKQLATEVFGSPETASKWLSKPHPLFGSKPPIGEIRSSYGAQHVKDVLLAIKYGGVV